MKKLRITVNNMVYDVTVQVLEDDEQVMSGAGYAGSAAGAAHAGARGPGAGARACRSCPGAIRAGSERVPTPSPPPSPARSRRSTSRPESASRRSPPPSCSMP